MKLNQIILVSMLLCLKVLANTVSLVPLPVDEAGKARTRCASLCGQGNSLYFTRYWANVLPGTTCLFYSITGGDTIGNWTYLEPIPKYVQEPPTWFSTNIMTDWAGDGLSAGVLGGEPYLFMFGSVPKGGTGEDINRDLFGYNITAGTWHVVTNRYDTGGTDGACTFVATDSIYGYWKGWTPMQRWVWDKNGNGIVQQQTVGAAALHPIDGTAVGDFALYAIFSPNQPQGRLVSIMKGGLTVVNLPNLPFNLGMGCAIEYVPAAYTLSGNDEVWVLRGGSGDNSGDGQGNNTPTKDVAVIEIATNATSVQVLGTRTFPLPFNTGAEGADMARVEDKMYFLRYDGAIDPELYFIPTTYYVQDPNPGPWPLNGNNKQRQGYYTGGTDMTAGYLVWTNTMQVGMGIWGSGVSDESKYYICLDANPPTQPYELVALDLDNGLMVWAADLDDWVNGTPAISADRIYSGDNAGNLYCYDKTAGTNIWKTFLATGDCNGGMLLSGGRLYAELNSGTTGGLYCVDATTGAILWLNPYINSGNWGGNGPSMSPDLSTIYVHTEDGRIKAINTETGTSLWTYTFGSGLGGQEPIVADDGSLYCIFGGIQNANDVVISFAPDGTTNWVYDFGMNEALSHGGYALSPDGATLYCSRRSAQGANGIGLTAIETATGLMKWQVTCGDTRGGCVVTAPGDIVVGAFETSGGVAAKGIKDEGSYGRILWSVPFDDAGGSHTWPTVLPNGDVIVAGDAGVIARIGVTNYPAIGWCNLQWPYNLTVVVTGGVAGVTDKVYGQVWIDGITSQPGPTPDLTAWIGWGPTNELPDQSSWTWQATEFNVNSGNNDEFWTNIVVAGTTMAGEYGYCYKYQYSPESVIGEIVYGQKDGPHTISTLDPVQYGILGVVPEPGWILMLIAGLAGLYRRR